MLNPPPSDDIDTNSFAYKQWFYMLWTSVSTTVVSAANSFIQLGAGAVIRTIQDKERDIVSVKDFGALGNGVFDDTKSIQSAITYAQSIGAGIFFPFGTYLVSSTLNITATIALYGASRFKTIITWTSTSLNVFSVVTDNQVYFEKFFFSGPGAAVSGSVISLAGNATNNAFSTIRDCTFASGYNQIYTVSSQAFTIDNCYLSGAINTAITVQNTYNADYGDSTITSCVISNLGATATGIKQISSGGLRVINNKILGGQYGYYMGLASAAHTSDLLISCNSFENQTLAAIAADTLGGGATFANIKIQGNQIALTPLAINFGSATAFMSRISITGNTIGVNASSSYAILLANITGFLVSDNEIAGSGGAPIGIAIGAASSNGFIDTNKYTLLGTKISNGSTTTYVAQPMVQKGVGAIAATATAVGSVFSGSVTVTFPVTYDSAPTVTCSPGTVTTGISAYASTVTATNFILVVIAGANTGAGNANWTANGVW